MNEAEKLTDQQEIDTNSYHSSLIFGDCLQEMVKIPSGSVDMVCADLPYGTTACKWDSVIPLAELWAEYCRVCKPNAAIVLTATQPFTSALVMSNPTQFKHEWIWHKSKSGSAFTAKVRPMISSKILRGVSLDIILHLTSKDEPRRP